MIFYVLLGIAALAVVIAITWGVFEDGFLFGLATGIIALIVSSVLLGIVAFGLSAWAFASGTDASVVDKRDLRSLGANSSIEGRFYFLGGGYVDGKRVLNYVVDRDGFSTLEQADASDSRIFEDTDADPFVESTFVTRTNWVLVPWPVGSSEQHDFHIPEGSILENFTIDN